MRLKPKQPAEETTQQKKDAVEAMIERLSADYIPGGGQSDITMRSETLYSSLFNAMQSFTPGDDFVSRQIRISVVLQLLSYLILEEDNTEDELDRATDNLEALVNARVEHRNEE